MIHESVKESMKENVKESINKSVRENVTEDIKEDIKENTKENIKENTRDDINEHVMENLRIGFIGCGNMGRAMIAGILDSGLCQKEHLIASAKSDSTLSGIWEQFKINTAKDNREVVAFSDFIFLAVKPQYYESIIEEIKDTVTSDKLVVSIAPGKTLDWFAQQFGKPVKLVRSMPNTPAMVKEGMMGICCNELVSQEERALVQAICSGFSKTELVPEKLMDVVGAVSGSSPAYVFLFIEAMADAAVANGMPRKQAYRFAAQAVCGSAKMVLETGMHPGELKDMVCSPGGTTIQAIRKLEEKGMRSAVFEAMEACMEKSRTM